MNRTYLISLIRSAAEQAGYAFYGGDIRSAAAVIRSYPAAWLETPQLVSFDGGSEGYASYRVTLRLLSAADRQSVLDPEPAWAALETDAMSIVSILASSRGAAQVREVKCTPSSLVTSNHGETALCITFIISVEYCL